MHTLDASTSESWLARDLKLIRRMCGMLLGYCPGGRPAAPRVPPAERRGEVLWLDEAGPTHHREEPLRTR